jgi:sugar phosphate isomerase/epimerase
MPHLDRDAIFMKKTPIALQLWSVRDHCHKDFAGTVSAVAKVGYEGVELAGYGNLDVNGVRTALGNANLKVAGMHVGIKALRGDLESVIGDALLLGTCDVICPWWPPSHFVSAAACEAIGSELDAIGATLRAYGLRLGYHVHDGEMKVIEGKTVIAWMLGASQPRNLTVEPDVYWIQHGGINPAKFLRDQGTRFRLIHLKDDKELGSGPVNFPEIFEVTDALGCLEWYVVEQEGFSHAPMISLGKNVEQLRAWGR